MYGECVPSSQVTSDTKDSWLLLLPPSHNDAVEDGDSCNHHESFVSEVTCEEGTHSPYMNSPMNTYRSVSTQCL